ncbi:MAG: aspartyl protease family protein [Rudaea sp.]|nr:aspartyl protease family protein [Rudaea sp.]
MLSRSFMQAVLAFIVLALTGTAMADDAGAVLARFKSVSGGEQWDAAHSWQGKGRLSTGGLSGDFHVTVDLLTGRSSDSYRLGPVDGADGYDGKQGWERDPGGEIAALDAPEAVRRARSQAWLDAHAYWYPQRIAAVYAKVETRVLDGRSYQVVEAMPAGGDPITLWLATDTGLLMRTTQRQGPDTATTAFDDYREVDGLRLPFRNTIDLTDAAGRTDPRRRTEVQLESVVLNGTIADADFAMPAMAATARIDDASGITRVPFDLVNNHIYVDGSVDGKHARFLVDTGGVNLLTPAAAKKFGIVGEGKLAAGGVGDQRADLAFAHAGEVRVGAATLAKPVFYIVDLGVLADVEGVAFDGLVGYEMFRRFGVQIDYARGQLTLSEARAFSPPAGADSIPFEFKDRIPIISGSLGGLPMRMSIDTGSRSSLTLNAPFVREHDLVRTYHAAPLSVCGWGVGGPSFENPARLPPLQIGNQRIEGIAGDLYTGDKGSAADPDLTGNLGGGVLRRFTVAFDYANKKMYLAPNAEFGKPDDFDRSGLWLLGDGDALKVADVARDSAGERAGMRVDDRITAIGGAAISTKSLAQWRAQLREIPVGSKLPVEFRRHGEDGHATLILADRIAAVKR